MRSYARSGQMDPSASADYPLHDRPAQRRPENTWDVLLNRARREVTRHTAWSARALSRIDRLLEVFAQNVPSRQYEPTLEQLVAALDWIACGEAGEIQIDADFYEWPADHALRERTPLRVL